MFNNGPSIFINYDRSPYREDVVNKLFDLPPEDDWPERGEAVKVIKVDEDDSRGGVTGYKIKSKILFQIR